MGFGAKAQALADVSGTTITVTATIAPARYIVVDNSGRIQKILSNTAQNVTPLVYKDSLRGQSEPYSLAISKQYAFITQHCQPLQKYGVFYDATSKVSLKPSAPNLVASIVKLMSAYPLRLKP